MEWEKLTKSKKIQIAKVGTNCLYYWFESNISSPLKNCFFTSGLYETINFLDNPFTLYEQLKDFKIPDYNLILDKNNIPLSFCKDFVIVHNIVNDKYKEEFFNRCQLLKDFISEIKAGDENKILLYNLPLDHLTQKVIGKEEIYFFKDYLIKNNLFNNFIIVVKEENKLDKEEVKSFSDAFGENFLTEKNQKY